MRVILGGTVSPDFQLDELKYLTHCPSDHIIYGSDRNEKKVFWAVVYKEWLNPQV